MAQFKRSNLRNTRAVKLSSEERQAFAKATKRFEKNMGLVRAESISKSARSQMSAAKIVLNR